MELCPQPIRSRSTNDPTPSSFMLLFPVENAAPFASTLATFSLFLASHKHEPFRRCVLLDKQMKIKSKSGSRRLEPKSGS